MATIIKYVKSGLLILTVQLFLASSCNKKGTHPCVDVVYKFNVTSEWTYEQDVYNIGDTIFLTSTFPKILTDQLSTSIVDYSNSTGIQGDLGIGYLDTVSHQPKPARDSFTIFPITGFFSERPGNQEWGLNFNYLENPGNYEFRAGFICRKKGIYTIGLSDLLSNGLSGKNCTNAEFSLNLINTNQHLYFHQYALNVDTTDQELQQKSYDFRVQ